MRKDLKLGLGLLPVLLVLGLAVHAAWRGWHSVAGTEMSGHGVAAMLLGMAATLALTGVLVALLLYSRRRGYDERVSEQPGQDPEALRRRPR